MRGVKKKARLGRTALELENSHSLSMGRICTQYYSRPLNDVKEKTGGNTPTITGDCSLVRRFCSPKVRESEIKGSSFRRFCSPKVRKSNLTTFTAFCYKGSVVRRFVSPK